MKDLITGIVAGYGWATPLLDPIKKTIKTTPDYVQLSDYMCSCNVENCKTHWCPHTLMLKTDCPCHRNGCGRIEPFVVSMRRSGYDGRCILITGNNNTGMDVLPRYGVETYEVGNFTDHACLVRPRATVNILEKEKDNLRYVLSIDTRDVIFQSNPMDWIKQRMGEIGGYSLIVTTEGSNFGEDNPNANENSKRFIATYGEDIFQSVKGLPICNGGILVGTPQSTIDFRRAMQVEIDKFPDGTPGYGPRERGWPSDQMIMNYLVHSEAFRNQTFIAGPRDGFAYHRCYGGMGISVRDNVIYPPDSSTPFPIVHQYLEWSKILWPRYSDTYQIKF